MSSTNPIAAHVLEEQQSGGIECDVTPPSPFVQLSDVEEWRSQYSATDIASHEPSQTPLSFISPLNGAPEQFLLDKPLRDTPGFDFLLSFLEPCRAVDIPTSMKYVLANFLRCTTEATCFDYFTRWMPLQRDLAVVDSSDHLDLPAWTCFLREHSNGLAADALSGIDQIRHDAVHRQDFTTDNIYAAVRLTLALNDKHRAFEIQHFVRSLYEFLSSATPSTCFPMLNALSSSYVSRHGQFGMLYSTMELLCDKIFDFVQIKFPGELAGQRVEDIEFPVLTGISDMRGRALLPEHEAYSLYWCLARLRRNLRNVVEHRTLTTAEQTRSVIMDGANVMLFLGDSDTAKGVLAIWKDFAYTMSNTGPAPSSWPPTFRRSMDHLDSWEKPSYPERSQSRSLDLAVRKHHPYLYCLRPLLEDLARKASQEADKWSRYSPLRCTTVSASESGLCDTYSITARWYRKISAGEIDITDARSPATDYWDGNLEEPVTNDRDSTMQLQPSQQATSEENTDNELEEPQSEEDIEDDKEYSRPYGEANQEDTVDYEEQIPATDEGIRGTWCTEELDSAGHIKYRIY